MDTLPARSADTRFDVLAVGELNPDLILAGIGAGSPVLGTEQEARDQRLTLGSSAAITLVRLQRLGMKTSLVARVGADYFGDFCRRELNEAGVDTGYLLEDPHSGTGLTVGLSYEHDRLLVTYPGAMVRLLADDVQEEALRQTRHLHVTSIFLQRGLAPDLAGLLERARSSGVSTSLDTGWDPADRWVLADLEPAFPYLDLLLPNESEALAMSGQATTSEASRWLLDRGVGRVVVKRGPHGAVSHSATGEASHPGFVIEPVDTTGAGDSFNAGYLYGFLNGLHEIARLKLANACGALAACSIGGTGGASGLAEVEEFVKARGEVLSHLI